MALIKELSAEKKIKAKARWDKKHGGIIALLGKEPDTRVAEKFSITRARVCEMRIRLGIPRYIDPKHTLTQEVSQLGLASDRRPRTCRPSNSRKEAVKHPHRGHATVAGWSEVSTILPDLRDPATIGCLLLLVREVWKSPVAQVSPSLPDGYLWSCYINDEAEDRYFREKTEAEALVSALETAP